MSAEVLLGINAEYVSVKGEFLPEDEEKSYKWSKHEVGLLYESLKELEQKVNRCLETQDLVHQLLGKVNKLERRLGSEPRENDDVEVEDYGSVRFEKSDLPDAPSSEPVPPGKSSKKPERCQICSRVYTSSWHLTRHMMTVHSMGKPLECSICKQKYRGRDRLRKHQNRQHGGVPKKDEMSPTYNCSKCFTQYETENDLKIHIDSEHSKFKCQLCDSDSMYNREEMAKHHKIQHPKPKPTQGSARPPRTCPVCSKVCPTQWHLDRHMLSLHSIGKPLKCSFCKKLFHGKGKLTYHQKREHGSVTVVSEEPEGEENQTSDEEHETLDNSAVVGPFKCKLCDSESVYNAEEMAEHYTSEHPKPSHGQVLKTNFSCPVCSKVCPRPWHLARHMLSVHAIGKPLECTICKQTFKGRGKLRVHQKRAHGGVPKQLIVITKPDSYNCPDCQKPFLSKDSVKNHLPACRGLRPFQCDECGQDFSYRSSLKQHTDGIHKQIRRCLCPHCGKRFYGAGHFNRHLRTHRGIKRSRSVKSNDVTDGDQNHDGQDFADVPIPEVEVILTMDR